MALLPNQIQVRSPKKADLRTPGCGEGKVQHLLKAASKESRWWVLKGTELLEGFQGKVFFFLRERFLKRVKEGSCGVCGQFVDILLILDDFL